MPYDINDPTQRAAAEQRFHHHIATNKDERPKTRLHRKINETLAILIREGAIRFHDDNTCEMVNPEIGRTLEAAGKIPRV